MLPLAMRRRYQRVTPKLELSFSWGDLPSISAPARTVPACSWALVGIGHNPVPATMGFHSKVASAPYTISKIALYAELVDVPICMHH